MRKLHNGWAQPYITSQAYLVALIEDIYKKNIKEIGGKPHIKIKYSYFLPELWKLHNGWAQPHETSQAYFVALIDEIYQKKIKEIGRKSHLLMK